MASHPDVVICFIGAPCFGKGAVGRALEHFHKGRMFKTLTMRQIIAAKRKSCTQFEARALEYEKNGRLIPNDEIEKLLDEVSRCTDLPHKTLLLDGVPRHQDQLSLVKKAFQRSRIVVVEITGSDEYSLEVFRATVNAQDRQGRLDADEAVHVARVKTYRNHLPDIHKEIRRLGLEHVVVPVIKSLKKRYLALEKVAELPPVQKHLLRDLEETLGLPKLDSIPQAA